MSDLNHADEYEEPSTAGQLNPISGLTLKRVWVLNLSFSFTLILALILGPVFFGALPNFNIIAKQLSPIYELTGIVECVCVCNVCVFAYINC